jgi:hypothetical protein
VLQMKLKALNEREPFIAMEAARRSVDPTRSPSPPPVYDANGVKTNTREERMRKELNRERTETADFIAKLDPSMAVQSTLGAVGGTALAIGGPAGLVGRAATDGTRKRPERRLYVCACRSALPQSHAAASARAATATPTDHHLLSPTRRSCSPSHRPTSLTLVSPLAGTFP